MRKIQIDKLAADMKFSQDVFIEGKNLLVPAGVAIKQKDLDQLKKWGITQVQTEGDQLPDAEPKAEGASETPHPDSILKPHAVFENSDAYRLYTDMVAQLGRFFKDFEAGKEPDRKAVELIVQSVIQAVKDKPREMIGFILGGDVQGAALEKSSLNSAILAVAVGVQMKLPAYRLLHLATGALLHDIGMLRIPDAIVHKQGDLSGDELQKMRAHPLLSHKIIGKELSYPEDVAQVALQHHERWDGEGYPRKVRGEDIDVLARIVSVTDAFEAMVSEKPYRDPMIGYTAVKALLSDNSRRFDPDVLRVFIRSMGIYPIGSLVLLNNSAIARVVDVHPDAPLRPKLRVLLDEYGRQYADEDGDLIDLPSERSLFIARAIDPKDFKEG
jgi:HD-GYP domain-containing protein (c-di-GMP phosphodiesterase class II)